MSSYEILDAISIYALLFQEEFWGPTFFYAPSGHRTPIANSGGISLIPYTTEAQQLTVLSKYNNIAHNNCNLFAHNC